MGMAALSLVLLFLVTILLLRTRRERALEAAIADERAREMDDKVAELTRIQSEMTGRMQTIAEVFGSPPERFRPHDLGADRRAAAPGRPGARGLDPPPEREPVQAQRAPRRDRRGAAEPDGPHRRDRRAQGHPVEQADPGRLRPGAHGGDRPRRAAGQRLRVPADAVEPHPARLPRAPAGRRARARHRRQVPARGLHALPRGARATRRGPARRRGCATTCWSM